MIRWKNFRGYKDTGWLTIRPLTILLGGNNSGKTSIMSPLLVLAQTSNSRDGDVPLVSMGSLVDLGTYDDFIHMHQGKQRLGLAIRFHTHQPPESLEAVGTYPPGGFELTFRKGVDAETVALSKVVVTDIFNRIYFVRSSNGKRFSLSHLPSMDQLEQREKVAIEKARPENFYISPNSVLFELERTDKRKSPDHRPEKFEFSEPFSDYLRATALVHAFCRHFFGQLSYVGPLRAKLKRYYRVSAEMPSTVGSMGEDAPVIFKRGSTKLRGEVNKWVQRFEFGDSLDVSRISNELFELRFVREGRFTNVADAGFGASQVLPLIIQAAAAPTDNITIAEQPEIHLNPRLQCVLGDLFAEMVSSGHRVLVETHSEHLIIRLRRLIAEGVLSPDMVALYFVSNTNGLSDIREIPIGRDGGIESVQWPAGFFEDGLREALGLATAQAKSNRQHGVRTNQCE